MQNKIVKFGLAGLLLLFISIIIIFIVSGPKYNAVFVFPPEVSENKIKELFEEFEKKKIPYKVKKGVIYYPKKHNKVALEIADKVILANDSSPRTKFTYKEHKEYFIELLENENIPYKVVV